MDTRECKTCWAQIESARWNRHKTWHDDIERKLRSLESMVRRVARA